MTFIPEISANELKNKLSNDLSKLGKLYKAKKGDYYKKTIPFGMEDQYLKDGWETDGKPLKTRQKIKKKKSTGSKFEDDIWCLMYEIGYRHLNIDETFQLPFNKGEEDKKQIDVIAIGKDEIILIECKATSTSKKYQFKDEIDLLGLRLDGFRKSLQQIFGEEKKVKFIFATRNYRIDSDSIDISRLLKYGVFHLNDNAYSYVNSLIKNYKESAIYQFKGLLFKNQLVKKERIEVPALEGNMGKKKYFMFSMEPEILLKMGFILHRTKANDEELPTYQRLLIPSRLKGISKFINEGGFFPNSIIININQNNHKLQFEAAGKGPSSNSKHGILKIPNAYAIAYIIDGQHRLYGYASSKYKSTNTIPVVAFVDLSPKEQLEIFMDINQNQKSVSPSLRLTLEEDLFWESDRVDSRLKALKSSIVKGLSENQNNVLYNKISIGEDNSLLSFKPFYKALTDSNLIPKAKGNKYEEDPIGCSLYNTNNQDHNFEMNNTRKRVIQLIDSCYSFVESNYSNIYNKNQSFVLSNRGTYAFIYLIGSLNSFLTKKGKINISTSNKQRFEFIEPFIKTLMEGLKDISDNDEKFLLGTYGSKGDIVWSRHFQSLVNNVYPDYSPDELIEWKERNDEALQEEGRGYGVAIEKFMKKVVLEKIKNLFGDNWELEINSIKRDCQDRAEKEMERYYKEFNKKKNVEWTEMFNINDYKTIIEKYWTKKPDNDPSFKTFENIFSINIGVGFNSKNEKTKWIAMFNSYRNSWAHEGTKEQGLNKEEVLILKLIFDHFELSK